MRSLILGAFLSTLFFCLLSANQSKPAVLLNTNILKPEAVIKINEIGEELEQKTGVYLGVAVSTDANLSTLQALQADLKAPYALFVMSLKDKKVSIEQNGTQAFLQSQNILEDSVYPLLGQKDKHYDAALLNGYADLSDAIARHYKVELLSSIGNANRDTLNFMRFIFWACVFYFLGLYLYKKTRKKYVK